MDNRTKKIIGFSTVAAALLLATRSRAETTNSLKDKIAKAKVNPGGIDNLVAINPNWTAINSGYANKVPEDHAITKGLDISVTSDFKVIAVNGTKAEVSNSGKILIDLVLQITNVSGKQQQIWGVSVNSTKYFGGSGKSTSFNENDPDGDFSAEYIFLNPGETKTLTANISFPLGTKTDVHLDFTKTLAVKII